MKKRKRIGIVFLIVFGLLFLFIGVLFLQGTCFASGNKPLAIKENEKWMSYIEDDTKVCEIAIPGSHDAGTKGIIYLSETQNFTIERQLEMGIRYLDLRVRKKKDNYYLYHSMFNGEEFKPVLDSIVSFIQKNPSETLLLDFQHFSNDSKADVYQMLKGKIVNQNLAVRNTSGSDDLSFMSKLPLGQARGKCILFFGEGNEYTEEEYIFARNNDSSSKTGMSLNSTYVSKYNKMSSKKYIEEGLPFYIEQIQNKIQTEGNKGIFVLQGQLTDGKYIFGPYSRERSNDKNMTKYIDSLKTSDDLFLINVIMRDYVNEEKCCQIISLNSNKKNVKSDHLVEFNSIYNS